jgi:hypothetical protein
MEHMNTSPQACPICHVGPDRPCKAGSKYLKRGGMHSARVTTEYGAWTMAYDRKYRELPVGKRFDLRPYERRAA